MKIRFLQNVSALHTQFTRRDPYELPDAEAQDWINRGLAKLEDEPVKTPAKKDPPEKK